MPGCPNKGIAWTGSQGKGAVARRTPGSLRKLVMCSALPPFLVEKRRLYPAIFRDINRRVPHPLWPRLTFLDGFLGVGPVSLYTKDPDSHVAVPCPMVARTAAGCPRRAVDVRRISWRKRSTTRLLRADCDCRAGLVGSRRATIGEAAAGQTGSKHPTPWWSQRTGVSTCPPEPSRSVAVGQQGGPNTHDHKNLLDQYERRRG